MIDSDEVLQKNCCNPFKTLKITIKQNLQLISVKLARDLQKNKLPTISGKTVGGNQD